MSKIVASRWPLIAFGFIALVTIAVTTRPAFKQQSSMVVVRLPGHRWFGDPEPAQASAAEDLPYALLSFSAYADPSSRDEKDVATLTEAQTGLGAQWHRWPDFPGPDLQKEMNSVHLRAQVWEKAPDHLIVVTFGGTVATNIDDWKSNAHWSHLFPKDEYTVLNDVFARAFAEELAHKIRQPETEYRHPIRLQTTGHSLGAGLAEKFAYSLPATEYRIPRVEKVYAFDPSPVTSFLNTKGSIRKENVQGLVIDRIFERGEVLAVLRAITAVFHRPSTSNPKVTQLRYNLFGNDRFGFTNPIANHSIQKLAERLQRVAAGKPPS